MILIPSHSSHVQLFESPQLRSQIPWNRDKPSLSMTRRFQRTSQVALVVNSLPANARIIRDAGLIPELGRSPGGGDGNPLQYSYLENPMDRGTWWDTVHGVTKSQTRLKRLGLHRFHEHRKISYVTKFWGWLHSNR